MQRKDDDADREQNNSADIGQSNNTIRNMKSHLLFLESHGSRELSETGKAAQVHKIRDARLAMEAYLAETDDEVEEHNPRGFPHGR